MQKTYCDRCNQPMEDPIATDLPDLTLNAKISSHTSAKVDLCNVCTGELIKWFGPTNPKTKIPFYDEQSFVAPLRRPKDADFKVGN